MRGERSWRWTCVVNAWSGQSVVLDDAACRRLLLKAGLPKLAPQATTAEHPRRRAVPRLLHLTFISSSSYTKPMHNIAMDHEDAANLSPHASVIESLSLSKVYLTITILLSESKPSFTTCCQSKTVNTQYPPHSSNQSANLRLIPSSWAAKPSQPSRQLPPSQSP